MYVFTLSFRLVAHSAQAYTILESSTKSVFLHLTISEPPAPTWGDILKSNSNGTYFGVSVDYVNRNQDGYVDFEKMIGLDGIALINVVSNPLEASVTGRKDIQSRITFNDGMRGVLGSCWTLTSIHRWFMEKTHSAFNRLPREQVRMH